MKRRKFIQTTGLSLPLLFNGFRLRAMPKSSIFSAIDETDRVLVLIQMNGGNDGLNMITPLDQYDKLANARGNILLPESSLLTAAGDNAFHPAMTGIKGIFDAGKMAVVQAVGYPNQNRSHFRSTDIWTSGSPAEQSWTTGWMGRYFEKDHPDYPEGYPGGDYPDPFALTIGSLVSETCQGTAINYSMALNDPFNLNPLASGGTDAPPNTPYGNELSFLRESIEQSNAYGEVIENAANSATNQASYPEDNALAAQLKTVALLIAGGLQTKVYVVSIGGFDTHSGQVVEGNVATGDHAALLKTLSDAMAAFQQDLALLGQEDRVLTMTFSEFGRRIRSNDSFGTDHGDAAPLMLFGTCVTAGFTGDSPEIPAQPEVQDAVSMQYDFRNIYGSIFTDWFDVPVADVQNLLFPEFQKIPILTACAPVATQETKVDLEVQFAPNPFSETVNIKFACRNEHVKLSVFNSKGQVLAVLVNKKLAAGEQELTYDASKLHSGSYYFHLQLEGGRQKSKLLVKAK